MTDKEKNLAIFNEMLKNAQEQFENEKYEVGTYTIQQLASGGLNHKEYVERTYRIEVDTFSCEYTERTAYQLLQQFARLAGVKCPPFTKESEETPICTFTMDVPKEAKHLANFVATDNYNKEVHPMLCNIFVDVFNETLCASNGHLLKTMHVEISDMKGEIKSRSYVAITAKDIKKICGRCEVAVYKDYDGIITEITDAKGVKYVFKDSNRRYPDYFSVYPKVSKKGYVKLTKDEAKRFAKWLRKSDEEVGIVINGMELKATREGNATTFALESNDAQCEMETAFKSRSLKTVCESGWDGGIWFTGSLQAALFDCDKADVTLIMPNYSYNMQHLTDAIEERNIPALERKAVLANEKAEEDKSLAPTEKAAEIEKEAAKTESVAPVAKSEKKQRTSKYAIRTTDGRQLREAFTFFEVNALKYAVAELPKEIAGTPKFTFGADTFTVLLSDDDRLTLRRESNGKLLEVLKGKTAAPRRPSAERMEAFAHEYGITVNTAWAMWEANRIKVA